MVLPKLIYFHLAAGRENPGLVWQTKLQLSPVLCVHMNYGAVAGVDGGMRKKGKAGLALCAMELEEGRC